MHGHRVGDGIVPRYICRMNSTVKKPPATRFWRYETVLIALLSLNFGIVFFDRNAMSYLGPFVQKDLQLTNGQIGLLASAFSIAWGLSGFLGGTLVDRFGHRKLVLVTATLAFSLCSFVSGFAATFGVLLSARILMGLFEGPMNPVQQSFAAAESSPERRGLNMGFAQNFGSSLFGSFIAPVVITALAVAYGWRFAFFAAATPGLLMALVLWLVLREPKIERTTAVQVPAKRMSLREMLRHRNIWLSMLISLFMVPWMILGWTFLPLLYANIRHFDPGVSSWLMATLGASAVLASFLLPGLSDRIGRKPVMVFGALLGISVPMAALYWSGSVWVLSAMLFAGWMTSGVFPLIMSTIPSETISVRYAATTCGLVQGAGEIIGGGGGAWAAGKAADAYGLPAALWIMAGCALMGGVLSLLLKETAPVKINASSALPALS